LDVNAFSEIQISVLVTSYFEDILKIFSPIYIFVASVQVVTRSGLKDQMFEPSIPSYALSP